MSQNLFFDSNLKLRIGRLTLEDLITLTSENMTVGAGKGEHKDPHRRPTPTISGQHEVTQASSSVGLLLRLFLSLSPPCVRPSLSSISWWPARMGSLFFLLFFLLPFFVLRSSLILNEKNLVFWVYTSVL
jgi:hypothetical protein